MLTALEALVDGCHHVGGLLPGVQQGRLKVQDKSNIPATFMFTHTVDLLNLTQCCFGLLVYLVDGKHVRQEVAAASA